MQKHFYFLIVAVLAAAGVQAQTILVQGTVKTNNSEPLATVTVSLLNAKDSSWVQTEMTDDNGSFRFKDVKEGAYIIDAHLLGYNVQQEQLVVGKETAIVKLVMQKTANNLKEVTITDKHPYIEREFGKTIVNVEQSTNPGNNVLDLLRRSPGVKVDGANNISMKGNAVLVLVDNKQTYLSGQELADYLRSIGSEQVAQLELITEPSAKYDAEGAGGIINIKTKKIKKKGYNGNVALEGGQSVYSSTHNSAMLNYRNNKLNVYTNAGYLLGNGFMDRHDVRKAIDEQTGNVISGTKQDMYIHETFEDYNLKLGADYAVNDKVDIGGSVKGIYHPNNERTVSHAYQENSTGDIVQNNTENKDGFKRDNYICNGYMRYTPSKAEELSADADYLYRRQNSYQNIASANYDGNGSPSAGGMDLRSKSASGIEATAVKVDYSLNIPKTCKLEAGAKTSIASANNGTHFDKSNNGVWINDTTRTNSFSYKENINAVYANVSKELGTKCKAQVGLRAENSNISGNQLEQSIQFFRSRTSLFPTGFLNYNPDEKNSFEISCGRRIERPAYTQLHPFRFYYSQFYFTKGNPDLKPSFRNYAECSYSHNNKLFASIGYRRVKGLITPVLLKDPGSNALYATWGNLANRDIVQGSLAYSDLLFAWWEMSAAANCYYNEFEDVNGNSGNVRSIGYDVSMNNHFELGGGWSIDTTLVYSSGDLQNLIDRYGPNLWLDMSIAKKLWKDKAIIKLAANDPFNIYRTRSTTNWNGVETASLFRLATHDIGVGFTYNFGKKADVLKKERKVNSEEAKRM